MANSLWRSGVGVILAVFAGSVLAEDVSIVGLFGDKAVLVIDGGAPRTLAIGQAAGRVKLVEVGKDAATVDINGRRAKISIGEPVSVGASTGTVHQVSLVADARGHFFTSGLINGSSVRFMVDTGATSVAMDRATAMRAGIVLSGGEMGFANTANGTISMIKVKIAKISVGDVTLFDVDATVLPTPMPEVLLGMSFLNRMEMRRDGSTMVLTQRY